MRSGVSKESTDSGLSPPSEGIKYTKVKLKLYTASTYKNLATHVKIPKLPFKGRWLVSAFLLHFSDYRNEDAEAARICSTKLLYSSHTLMTSDLTEMH